MNARNVTLTLDKAKEFYNSDNEALKEIALQAYTKKELTALECQNIKTFEDACEALDLDYSCVKADLHGLEILKLEAGTVNHVQAIYKLDIIRKALNGGWKPSLVQDSVYYPYVRFYPAGQKTREAASSNNWELGESFIADGKKYTLVGGDCVCFSCGGLAGFSCGYGVVQPYLGLLGCKSREIAEHMSCYFSKEIFEATYAHHAGTYQWV